MTGEGRKEDEKKKKERKWVVVHLSVTLAGGLVSRSEGGECR